jgi:DNA-binding CsgD family transcriptional regulator
VSHRSPTPDAARIRGRDAFERRAWRDAYEALTEAAAASPLHADDVERLALSASLTGHEPAALEAFERLHHVRLEAGETHRAARAAYWLSMRLFSLGETARASGWLARAQRLVESEGSDSVERGYLKLPQVFRFTAAGDYVAARATAADAAEIGARHGDRDLQALARSFEGRALIRQGKLAEGLALLDEAMLDVTSHELSAVVTGLVYCGAIAACQQSYALDRAREWTAALSDWCEEQPQLVSFAGACLIHRSEILQLGGAWPEAVEEARRASQRLAPSRGGEAGNAFYQQAELHRLRGETEAAERAYAMASERGRDPQPGLSLLRLAQGRVDLAAAAMRRVLAATSEPLKRTAVLPAHVEIMLAAGDLAEARRAAAELSAIGEGFGLGSLSAMADHALGTVVLAEGDARGAIEPLRRAQELWQHIGAPYPSARVRVAVARAFRALGDHDGAALELAAARKLFAELGAAAELAAMEAPSAAEPEPAPTARDAHGLSARELEVLRLLAAGATNKLIARKLFVSERTIDRHVSNIFAKLDVPTRAAATAWAYQHGVVG